MKKLYFLLGFFAFLSCEMEQPEPEIIEITDTVFVDKIIRDTVYITETDTVETIVTKNVYLDVAGDTVKVTDTVYVTVVEKKEVIKEVLKRDTIYVEKIIKDTVYITKTDTLYIRDTVFSEPEPEKFLLTCTNKDKESLNDNLYEKVKNSWMAFAKDEEGGVHAYVLGLGTISPKYPGGWDISSIGEQTFYYEDNPDFNFEYECPYLSYDMNDGTILWGKWKLEGNTIKTKEFYITQNVMANFNPYFDVLCINRSYMEAYVHSLGKVVYFYSHSDLVKFQVNRCDLPELNSYEDIRYLINEARDKAELQ